MLRSKLNDETSQTVAKSEVVQLKDMLEKVQKESDHLEKVIFCRSTFSLLQGGVS